MIRVIKSYVKEGENPVCAEIEGELRRCPFCGSEAEIVRDGPRYYYPACSECPIEMHEIYFTAEEAACAWNGTHYVEGTK